jgi:hypothetical protein
MRALLLKRVLLAAFSNPLASQNPHGLHPIIPVPFSSLRPKWHRVFGEAGAGQPFATKSNQLSAVSGQLIVFS